MESEKRRELDPTFKQMIMTVLEPLSVTVETEVEVSRLPRTIDVIVVAESDEAHEQLRTQTPFGHFRTHNQIEFKGEHDPLTLDDYAYILGRSYLYIGDHKTILDEMTVTIICARKPRNVLKRVSAGHTFANVGAGLYQNGAVPQITLVVINELPETAENYPLLLFAGNEKKFREVFLKLLAENRLEFVSYALRVRPHLTEDLLVMNGIYEDNLKIIARDMGEDILPHISPEKRLQGISPEKRLQGISPEKRLEGISPDYLLDHLLSQMSSGQVVELMSVEEVALLKKLRAEKMIFNKLDALSTAEERIGLIEALAADDRAIALDEENREKLLEGLDDAEQSKLLAWIAEQ